MYMMNETASSYVMASRDGDTKAYSDDVEVAMRWLEAQEIPAVIYQLSEKPALQVGTGPRLFHHELVAHNMTEE